jgi:hypothetical protein
MDYVAAIVPSVGVLALFVIAMRGIFHADQRERLAQAQIERAEQAGDNRLPPAAGPNPSDPRPADPSGNQAPGGGSE